MALPFTFAYALYSLRDMTSQAVTHSFILSTVKCPTNRVASQFSCRLYVILRHMACSHCILLMRNITPLLRKLRKQSCIQRADAANLGSATQRGGFPLVSLYFCAIIHPRDAGCDAGLFLGLVIAQRRKQEMSKVTPFDRQLREGRVTPL